MKKQTQIITLIFVSLSLASLACQVSLPFLGTIQNDLTLENIKSTDSQTDDFVNTELISETITIPTSDLSSQEDALVNVYKNANPGVVFIVVHNEIGFASGSGFVIDKEGHIVTNLHVVEGAFEIQITFPSGVITRAEIVGEDSNSDLALIKVELDEDKLFPLVLGSSDTLQVGQLVVAIGNPFGLAGTMTTGIVSGLGRSLQSLNATVTSNFLAGDIIQTDAAINPGNSGGPLLNLNGEVIGVNRAIRTFSSTEDNEPLNSGIGFAVSVDVLKRVIPDLIEKGEVEYPYLGVVNRFDQIPLSYMEEFGLERAIGALVSSVSADGPAEKAGIESGDLIIKIENHDVLTFTDLIAYLFTDAYPGDVVQIIVLRDGKEEGLDLEIGVRP